MIFAPADTDGHYCFAKRHDAAVWHARQSPDCNRRRFSICLRSCFPGEGAVAGDATKPRKSQETIPDYAATAKPDSGGAAMLFRLAFAIVSITALLVDPISSRSQDL